MSIILILPFYGNYKKKYDPMLVFPQNDAQQRGWKSYIKAIGDYVKDLGGYVDPETQEIADARTADEHYRAINLEHADARKENDDISTSARIEMRHYAAQLSFNEFKIQAKDLCDLIILSRIFALINAPYQDYLGIEKDTRNKWGSTSPSNPPDNHNVKAPWLAYMKTNNEPTKRPEANPWIYA